MKKNIHVKHQHRYSFEVVDQYQGEADFTIHDQYEKLVYYDHQGIRITLYIYDDHLNIERKGELHSSLSFIENKKTKNMIKSDYGDIEIELFTYQYDKKKNQIIIDYDVVSSSSDKDGYYIEFKIEEDVCEYN